MQYGGFWIRVLACIIDSLIVSIGMIALGAVAALANFPKVGAVASFAFGLLYWPVMHASERQATYGKALLGLQVGDADGERISFLRALGRELAKIVSALPLMIGFLFAAFTERKQALHDYIAATTVVRVEPGHVVAGLALALFALLAPVIVVVAFGAAFVAGFAGGMAGLVTGAKVAERKLEPAKKGQIKASAPVVSAAPAPATSAEGFFASRLTLDRPNSARAGPALLELSTAFSSSFWIKTYAPPAEGFDVNAVLAVSRVLDRSGAELYDPAHRLETAFFRRVNFMRQASPVPHLSAIRSVHVREGAATNAIERVEGTLRFSLPLNPQAASFAFPDVGRQVSVHGSAITLKAFSATEVELHFKGEGPRFLAVQGYAADGQPLTRHRLNWDKPVDTTLKAMFNAPVAKVDALVAQAIVEREFPFTLAAGQAAR